METDFKPNIVYIDEIEDERDNFFNDLADSEHFGEIHLLPPEPDLQEMLLKIIDLQIDALVTDFNLSEAYPVPYNGEELVSAFLNIRDEFPCFIRTAVDSWMQTICEDVNRVYSKNSNADESVGRHLQERIPRQVQLYRQKINKWQNELTALSQKNSADRTAEEVERILELDTKIEASIGNNQAIPKHLKGKLFETESRLLDETERLIQEIKEKLGDE